MARTFHFCQSVRGVLRFDRREMKRATKWMLKSDGSRYTPDELREVLFDELAQGHEVIPIGECDNFDFKTGCKGHPTSD